MFLQTQMVFDLDAFATFLQRARDLLDGARLYAGVALLRTAAMAERVRALPGCALSDADVRRIATGEGSTWPPSSRRRSRRSTA